MIINDSLENYTPSATRYAASELFYNRCGRSGVMLPKVLWVYGITLDRQMTLILAVQYYVMPLIMVLFILT